jgi:YidC/Oxa1 family membrane protein insertase
MNQMLPDDPTRETDRSRSLMAIVLCVLLYVGYTEYMRAKYPDYMKPRETAGENTGANVENAAGSSATTPGTTDTAATQATAGVQSKAPATPAIKAPAALDPAQLVFETDDFKVTLDQSLSAISSVRLKKFSDRIGAGAQPVEVLDSPLVVQGVVQGNNGTNPNVQSGLWSAARSGDKVTFSRDEGTWRIEQEIEQRPDSYNLAARVKFTNISTQPQSLTGGALLSQTVSTVVESASSLLPGSPTEKPRIVAHVRDSDEFVFTEKFCEDGGSKDLLARNQDVRFVGFDRHYFLAAFIPAVTKTQLTTWVGGTQPASKTHCPVSILFNQEFGTVSPGATVSMDLDGFIGPKISEYMKKRSLYLPDTLDRGWFDALAEPLLLAIKGFESVLKNYGLAIILLTVLLKVLFYPLTKKAAESAHKMKKFNPEMQRIRERYKDDPRTQQQEVMRFMAAHKLNPMQGCLPILPQIPVFLAFYRVLSSAIELRHAPFFGWIQDLSVADPYFVTPLLLGAGMFLQQKLTPMAGMDKTQEKVMLAMPIVFTVMMLTLPAGMVLYMLANTVMSIAQQQWLNRKLARELA